MEEPNTNLAPKNLQTELAEAELANQFINSSPNPLSSGNTTPFTQQQAHNLYIHIV